MGRSMRVLSWSGLALVAAAALGAGCGRTSPAQVDAGQEVAATFLEELRAGRVAPAWQGTTVEFKSLMGSDALRDYVRAHPAFQARAEFVASESVESGRGRMVAYRFRATPPPGKKKPKTPPPPATIRVLLDFTADPPRVERLNVE